MTHNQHFDAANHKENIISFGAKMVVKWFTITAIIDPVNYIFVLKLGEMDLFGNNGFFSKTDAHLASWLPKY